jgi:hypothetical protein
MEANQLGHNEANVINKGLANADDVAGLWQFPSAEGD